MGQRIRKYGPVSKLSPYGTPTSDSSDSIFAEPSKVDPSGFENQPSIPPYCHIPFGGGPHLCPEYELAKIEILDAINYLVTGFTWKPLCSGKIFSGDSVPFPTKGLVN
ncbi:hypothetical protein Pint_04170 [Pistacia integerrima]|uniref:Uncharacterized protein n=1 Tax=Pistacia integerrima TaxID=434235 RepID=A0ACC0Z6N1_9ROSI|nr:hypothetical protein Pint_04170 [Pistacia integerrima]